MNAPSLDVFSLRDSVVDEYKRFATSFTTIHAEDIRGQIEAIYAQERYWPEPLIQINPSYKRTTDVGALVGCGLLEIYDALAEATRTGKPYVSPLGPGKRANGEQRRANSGQDHCPRRAT